MCLCHRLLLLVTDWNRHGVYGFFRDQLHLTTQERACRAMSLENLVQGQGLRQRHADAIDAIQMQLVPFVLLPYTKHSLVKYVAITIRA